MFRASTPRLGKKDPRWALKWTQTGASTVVSHRRARVVPSVENQLTSAHSPDCLRSSMLRNLSLSPRLARRNWSRSSEQKAQPALAARMNEAIG